MVHFNECMCEHWGCNHSAIRETTRFILVIRLRRCDTQCKQQGALGLMLSLSFEDLTFLSLEDKNHTKVKGRMGLLLRELRLVIGRLPGRDCIALE